MTSNTNLSVRICGIAVACLKVRREIRDGQYTGRNELVFEDPILGFMPLDNSFSIELKRLNIPLEDRAWERTDVEGLYAALIDAGLFSPHR